MLIFVFKMNKYTISSTFDIGKKLISRIVF